MKAGEETDGGAELARTTRLFAILAREAPVAVVFRRGPSKQVQLLRWDLAADRVEPGQWFNGRIYERRCDLSPSGCLLIYFAAKYRRARSFFSWQGAGHPPSFYSWTAVSRPPFFTALALWPKVDTWGGGGAFADETHILLNHSEGERVLADGFRLKGSLKVAPLGIHSGRGEDGPVQGYLRARSGWRLVSEGSQPEKAAGYSHAFALPRIWQKAARTGRRLQERLHAIGGSGKPWYSTSFQVLADDGTVLIDLPDTDWADWDGGDLVFARQGCLWRLNGKNFGRYRDRGREALKLVADLGANRFTPIVAPGSAHAW